MMKDDDTLADLTERYGDEFVSLLRSIDPDAEVPPPPSGMAEQFEEKMREQAREARKRFVPFALGAYAIFSLGMLLPLIVPKPGGMDGEKWLQLGIVLFGGATVFAGAVWMHTRRLLRSDDVIGYMARSERRVPESVGQRLTNWVVLGAALVLLAGDWGIQKTLAWTGGIGLAMFVFVRWARARLRRDRMRQDPELWSWWYEEAV